jgi:hypothetical protein
MEILNTLENDKLNRHKNGKLFRREEVNQTYRFQIDTADMFYYVNHIGGYYSVLKDRLANLLEIIPPPYINFVVAGGWFTNRKIGESDIDIFIYGDHEATLERLIKLLKKQKYKFERRTRYYIQFEHTDFPPVQIIFRKYTTIAEILYGFDVGSSQICFDGKDLLFTYLSKFAFETSFNIVDSSRLSPSYESRLLKYADRGFRIIFPFLSKSLISNRKSEVVIGNFKFNQNDELVLDVPFITGEEYDTAFDNNLLPYGFDVKNNIRFLLGTGKNFYVDENNRLKIDKMDIKGYYLGNIKINDIYKNVTMYKDFDTSYQTNDKIKLVKYIKKKSIETANFLFENYKKEIGYYWITENPGQQLSGSITPQPTNPSIYYGSFYNPLWSLNTHSYCTYPLKDIMFYLYYFFYKDNLLPIEIAFFIMEQIALIRFITPPEKKIPKEIKSKKNQKRKNEFEDAGKYKIRKGNNGPIVIIIKD